MKRTPSVLLILALCLGPVLVRSADQPDPDRVKERMKTNLPAIDKLKKAGKIGENNKAYLEARAPLSKEDERLVKTENQDRKVVYQLLAGRAKTTLEKIQEARAAQIRRRSAPGIWLQSPEGKWYQKEKGDKDKNEREEDQEEERARRASDRPGTG